VSGHSEVVSPELALVCPELRARWLSRASELAYEKRSRPSPPISPRVVELDVRRPEPAPDRAPRLALVRSALAYGAAAAVRTAVYGLVVSAALVSLAGVALAIRR
jgi:hypothetical protein